MNTDDTIYGLSLLASRVEIGDCSRLVWTGFYQLRQKWVYMLYCYQQVSNFYCSIVMNSASPNFDTVN